jgi:hypothetical protein
VICAYTGLYAVNLNTFTTLSVSVQILCYIVAMILTFYLFLNTYMEKDYQSFAHLDDVTRDELTEKSKSVESDTRGIDL